MKELTLLRIFGSQFRQFVRKPQRYVPCVSFSQSVSCHQENSPNIIKSDRTLPILKGVAITDHVFQDLGKWSTATAMECSITGRKYTHGQTYKLARGFGTALLQMGFKKSDVLAICIPNMPEYPLAYFGAWFARMTVTPVNPSYTGFEIGKQLLDCGAKCMVTIPPLLPLIREAQTAHPTLASMKVITIGEPQEGCHNFGEMVKVDSSGANLASSSDPDLNTEEDVILLPYSSGTTGPPKGVMLTHFTLVNNVSQTRETVNVHPFCNGNYQEVGMALLPFFHIMAFQTLGLVTFTFGSKVLYLPKFDPESFVKCLKQNKLTYIHLVAPLIQFIINHPGITKEEFSICKTAFNGACPTSPILIDKFLEKVDNYILLQEGYGMTELSPLSHMILPNSKNAKVGSVGLPVQNTMVKVVGETGKALGVGERGEIFIKGPQIMKGYYKNDAATKATITDDGWLKTGDVGYYDEDKYFYVVDRLKELIKVKGFQVSPSELEATLRIHPGIGDVAVVGVPHKDFGESPVAFVVKNGEVSKEEVAGFLKDKLSAHKQLSGVEFVNIIPKAQSGKILRRELLTTYLEQQKQK